ncbi:endolytic transglycosylase MltG [candidate division KSB1 bacterium]
MKKFSSILIFGLLVFGVILFYQFYIGALNYSLDPNSDQRVAIDIRTGSTASSVANLLEEKGLIKSQMVFNLYLKQNDMADQIKAGRIVLQEDFNLKQIATALVEGKSEEMAVTILEGWTIDQIAEYLEDAGLTTADEFLNCIETCSFEFDFLPEGYLEGYLYPDTYFVNLASYSDERFIARMIQTLENRLDDDVWIPLEKENRTLEDVMIMASIVEREERDPDERPIVAGILWNRFDAQIGLGADATILYALGRTKGGLTYTDLEVDSPYNTRKYRRLPPTPIANPSISSIKAAADPAVTDYWYYLHDSDGEVHYAETNDEHNANKAKWL